MKNKFVDFKVLATSLCCSVAMGLISFAFLKCLEYAADFRSFFPLCYMFLPVAGIVTAFVYKRVGGKSSMGNNIIIESANDGEKVPKRLASLTFIFTCITHLFGGSVGREGTAVQIGGSLTSNVADYLGFKNNDRSTIVLSGISSAFGSVFGTPFAGAFFGMEVCCVGRLSAGAVIPCFACSYLANFVTQLLGFKHERYAISSIPDFDARFLFVFLIYHILLNNLNYPYYSSGSVSCSSSVSSSPKLFSKASLKFSLIFFSISFIVSGLSSKYFFTFSLPCPILSPL